MLLGILFAQQINKSAKLDKEATKKNIKAFTKIADANAKLEKCQSDLLNQLQINSKRKNGLITYHLSMFQEQYSIIRKIQFGKGRGIEEIEKIDAIQNQIKQYVELPAVTSGMIMKNSQYAISFALMGIGGVMIKESKMNLKTASKNTAMASAVTAQIDSICIALEGITQHTMIITELLEKLGMLYMKSIKNISIILKNNGLDSENYSEDDINALNVSLSLTKLIYRIINTPLLDENGNIEKESIKVIQQGRDMLKQIQ